MKMFKDQIQFIQNTQSNISRASSDQSTLLKSLSVSSFAIAQTQAHFHKRNQKNSLNKNLQSQLSNHKLDGFLGSQQQQQLSSYQLPQSAKIRSEDNASQQKISGTLFYNQQGKNNSSNQTSNVYQNLPQSQYGSPSPKKSQNHGSILPPVQKRQSCQVGESNSFQQQVFNKISESPKKQNDKNIKFYPRLNALQDEAYQIEDTSKSTKQQFSRKHSMQSENIYFEQESQNYTSKSISPDISHKNSVLKKHKLMSNLQSDKVERDKFHILSNSFSLGKQNQPIQCVQIDSIQRLADEQMDVEFFYNNSDQITPFNVDQQTQPKNIQYQIEYNCDDNSDDPYLNNQFKQIVSKTQIEPSLAIQSQKKVPEDFAEAIREVTHNNQAQEFHRYCFQALLKRKNKKFRNIYQGNIPLFQRQPSYNERGLPDQVVQQNDQSKFKDISQILRCLISDLKVFDYYEIDSIVDAAQSENFPIVSAKAWVIAESKKGVVMHGKDQSFQREIASLTKIMTAYTICRLIHEINITNPKNVYLRVSKKAAHMNGTSAFLKQDQRINIYDCLHALLLPSGNDAAIVLATAFGKWLYFANEKARKANSNMPNQNMMKTVYNQNNLTNQQDIIPPVNFEQNHDDYILAFVQEMNKQARKIKLDKLNFSNPHGLSEKANHASPADICIITAHALKYDLFKEISSKKQHDCTVISRFGEPIPYSWNNSNKLLNQYFQGVKTGVTPTAGPCLCGLFSFQDYNAIACIMDCKNVDVRWKEMATLMLWALDKYLKKNQWQQLYTPANYMSFGKKQIRV